MRTWLTFVAVMVWASLLVDESSAFSIDYTCTGAMGNRDIYNKVSRVCDDCANIYRLPGLDGMCRNRCFNNFWFMICLRAAKREDEIDKFRVWISILNPGGAW
uniref:Gonad-inhibiting hormone n=1 Tax=Metapenaeus ensis TaxID=32278 RepID=Q8WTF0_METEN|nr:gonad-inhibiting hormone [Metapenaeus ensis]